MTITNSQTERDTLRAVIRENELWLRTDRQWRELMEHVNVHRYLINQDKPWTLGWDEALQSWRENVLDPVLRACGRWRVYRAFPGMTRGELYLAMATHWYYMIERDASVDVEAAARDFTLRYGKGLARWFSRFLAPRG